MSTSATEKSIRVCRPLVGVALAVGLGMVLAAQGVLSVSFVLWSVPNLLLFALLFRARYGTHGVLFVALGLLGAGHYLLSPAVESMVEEEPSDHREWIMEVRGTPRFFDYGSGFGSWVIPVVCEGVKDETTWRRQRGTRLELRLTGGRKSLGFRPGDRLYVQGTWQQNDIPGASTRWAMALKSRADWVLLSKGRLSILQRWSAWFQRVGLKHLSVGAFRDQEAFGVENALLLGNRDAVAKAVYDLFRQTGTLHIFAISGLHVGMVALLLSVVLKTGGVPRDRWGVWLFPLLLLYVLATGMKVSALRAVLMAGLYFLGPLLRRKPDIPSSIACAALLILVWDPMQLKAAGFIFSFAVVSMIVMVYSALPDAWLAGGDWWCRVKRYAFSLIFTSAAAFLGAMPLSAFYFKQITPVVLLSNLVAVPLTFLIVLSGWVSILLGGLSSSLAACFNLANDCFARLLIASMGWFAGLPGAHVSIGSPEWPAVGLWFTGWIGFFTWATHKKERRLSLAVVLAGVLWAVF